MATNVKTLILRDALLQEEQGETSLMGPCTGHSRISKHSTALGENAAAAPSAEQRRAPGWATGVRNDICQTLGTVTKF